jgi:hypothetical protein
MRGYSKRTPMFNAAANYTLHTRAIPTCHLSDISSGCRLSFCPLPGRIFTLVTAFVLTRLSHFVVNAAPF